MLARRSLTLLCPYGCIRIIHICYPRALMAIFLSRGILGSALNIDTLEYSRSRLDSAKTRGSGTDRESISEVYFSRHFLSA
jgi:hypothetical protein